MQTKARKFRSSLLGLIALGVLAPEAAPAQTDPLSPAETRQAAPLRGPQAGERGELPGHTSKRTVLHFEDDSIRGDLTRPDGELVQAPRRVAEGSLVRLRTSFIDRALGGAVRGE